MRAAILMLALVSAVRAADPEPVDPAKLKVRELELSVRLPGKEVGPPDPVKIATVEELTKFAPEKTSLEALKKEVDFRKEYLLVFVWSGSGEDRLTHAVRKRADGAEGVFTFEGGKSKDLRRHQKAFVLPKNMAYRLAK